MHRSNANDDLSAYLDGELTDAEAAELEAELARDPALQQSLAEIQRVVRWLHEEGPDQAPLGMHHRIMDQIDQMDPPRGSAWAWLRRPFGVPLEGWLVAAAAAAVLLLALPKEDPNLEAWPTVEPEASTSPAALKLPLPDPVDPPPPVEPTPTIDPAPPEDPPTKAIKGVGTKGGTGDGKGGVEGLEDPVVDVAPTAEGTKAVEGTPTQKAPELASPGYTYTVRSRDPGMKRAVLALAGRYGGASTASGSEVLQAQMVSNRETLVVQVPQDSLNRFGKELEALGYAVERSKDNALLPGTLMPVRITLLLEGGSTAPKDDPAHAARQYLEQADAVFEGSEE